MGGLYVIAAMKLIVGLGNPGKAYAANRHNVGAQCLGHFARLYGIPIAERKGRARVGSGEVAGVPVVLARPRTYMNQSGQAVAPLMRRLRLSTEDLVVVYDDLDLPLGRVRIRQRGGSAGHRGVESIVSHLGSQEFARVRVGIGRPEAGDEVSYVLSDFTAAEMGPIREAMATVSEALYSILTEGVAAAMNRYN
ncbi:MAG: aminoacyl-tRNA hydrolase [Chloroflexota bacterium]|nr:aminoacyl-tRNA hydrolase [Chloroflexota bacterium]